MTSIFNLIYLKARCCFDFEKTNPASRRRAPELGLVPALREMRGVDLTRGDELLRSQELFLQRFPRLFW